MIVTIHQPDFLPWLGFFDRWAKSDIYIVLDDVQFIRRGWHHRDRIKAVDGPIWLTVPVVKKNRYHQLIKDTEIDNSLAWRKKHLRMIELNYRKAPNFEYFFHKIKEIYESNHLLLIELNMDFLRFVAGELRIDTPFKFASSLNISSSGNQRLVDLVKSVNGSSYLTGLGSKSYLDEDLFRKEDIKVIWQNYSVSAYKQLHGNFERGLSVLDYLMMANDIARWKNTCQHQESR